WRRRHLRRHVLLCDLPCIRRPGVVRPNSGAHVRRARAPRRAEQHPRQLAPVLPDRIHPGTRRPARHDRARRVTLPEPSMSATTVGVEKREAVAIVTLNRPDISNALNLQMGMDLLAAAMACERDPGTRAVVLTGAGKHFCFGGDLRAMVSKGVAIEA